MANPDRKAFDIGGIKGVIYFFAHARDMLPMHQHEPCDDHISIVGRGAFSISSPKQAIAVTQGQVVDFRPSQPHEITATEDGSIIINIYKKNAG